MNRDDWIYSETPTQPGWYATLHGWDIREGVFPQATEWLGDRWARRLPILAWQGPFANEDATNMIRSDEMDQNGNITNEWDAGLGTTPDMWAMLSDYLEEDEVVLTESLNAAIIDLAEGRAFVIPRVGGVNHERT